MQSKFLGTVCILGVVGCDARLRTSARINIPQASTIPRITEDLSHQQLLLPDSHNHSNSMEGPSLDQLSPPKQPVGSGESSLLLILDKELEPYKQKLNLTEVLYACLILAGLVAIAALAYRHYKKDPKGLPNDGLEHKLELVQGRWRHGLFDCFGNLNICCFTCCCPAIRWADTIRMAGFLGFWAAFLLFMLLELGNPLTAGLSGLALLIVVVVYRQKQRQMFEMQHGNCSSYLEDCLTYACCSCCAIIQEARHMEEAWALGHDVVKAPIVVKKASGSG